MQDYILVRPGNVMFPIEHEGSLYLVTETGVFRRDNTKEGKFYEVDFMVRIPEPSLS